MILLKIKIKLDPNTKHLLIGPCQNVLWFFSFMITHVQLPMLSTSMLFDISRYIYYIRHTLNTLILLLHVSSACTYIFIIIIIIVIIIIITIIIIRNCTCVFCIWICFFTFDFFTENPLKKTRPSERDFALSSMYLYMYIILHTYSQINEKTNTNTICYCDRPLIDHYSSTNTCLFIYLLLLC